MKKNDKLKQLKLNWPSYLLKLSISAFILAIFLVIFFVLNGVTIFYKTTYVSNFVGNEFQIHAIDVGQGDSFLIKLPGSKTMLIDCGNEESGEVVKSYISQYFAKEKTSQIDYFVLTHTDLDHIGGAKEIVNNFAVKNLYRPKCYCKYESEHLADKEDYKISYSSTYDYCLKKAYQNNTNIVFNQRGITIEESGFKIEFLSPYKDTYSNSNDYSAVIMISCNGKKALFTGDAGKDIENNLISQYGNDLKADILKLGHHGANASSSEEFLNKVNPSYAILSVDKNNNYNLPSVEVLNKLHIKNINIESTSNLGNFAISIKNDDIVVSGQSQNRVDVALILSITIILLLITWALPIKIENKKLIKIKK